VTTSSAAFEIPANVLYREVDGQLVLLDLDREEYFGLDEIGAEMVRYVTATSVDEAITALDADYEVGADVLRADLDALVASLLAAGLLERVEGTG